ncbi:hypothetical protein SKAU_G00281280 [Synaphobranchus kaupii]|uniref:MULE transposase domain-containing protein n=1 Tax=Synaphobranchus kaupii TaxID=118154 RepID=A0A9Q1EX54_SYNKA|nr:hypothetical protein SKAU_G00281280 [Synaphobranchus kaupii]
MRHFSYKYCTLPELTSKRIVTCTDREAAIENAIEKVLPTVPIVNCWNHLMQNVKHTVRGCGGTKEDVEVYQAHLNQLLSCISLTQYHTVKQDISSMCLRGKRRSGLKGPTEEQLKVVVPAPDSKLGIQNQNILADSSATNGHQPTHPSKDLKNTDEDINDVLADTRASSDQQQDTQEDTETMLNDPETSKKKFQNEAIQLWGGECSNDIVAVMDTQGNMVLRQEEFLYFETT